MTSQQIVCDECGIRHDAALAVCPWCGFARSEGAITEAEPVTTASASASASATAPTGQAHPAHAYAESARRRYRRRRAIVAVTVSVALVALGAFLAEIIPVGSDSSTPSPAVPTAAPAAPTTAAPAPESTTTAPPQTTQTAATTRPTTTSIPPAPASITPVGEPIPISDLALKADGIGPLEFGNDGTEVLGRLAASLGQPTSDTGEIVAEDDASGLCPGATVRHVAWGSLNVFAEVSTGAVSFVSYRMTPITEVDPAADLETLSGIALGNSVDDLLATYDTYNVAIDEYPWGTGFELRSTTDGRLLLWGQVTVPGPDGIILGINSAERCEEV